MNTTSCDIKLTELIKTDSLFLKFWSSTLKIIKTFLKFYQLWCKITKIFLLLYFQFCDITVIIIIIFRVHYISQDFRSCQKLLKICLHWETSVKDAAIKAMHYPNRQAMYRWCTSSYYQQFVYLVETEKDFVWHMVDYRLFTSLESNV